MNTKIIIGIVAILVIAGAVFIVFYRDSLMPEGNDPAAATPAANTTATSPTAKDYRAADLARVAVPEANSKDVPEDIARPDVVVETRVGSDSSIRSFEVSIEGEKMNPPTIIVRQNDTVHIRVSSLDKQYKMVQPDYGLKLMVPAGEFGIMEFSASASGKFSFLCDGCAGVNQTTLGQILVTPL